MSLTPYGQEQHPSTTIIGVNQTSVQAVQVGDVQAARATQQNLLVRTFGRPISGLRNNIHSRTNFYIQQSRPFIPRRTLRTYFCVRFMKLAFYFYLALCIPLVILAGIADFVAWPWAAITGGLGLIWLLIFSQHMHVMYWTIPAVLSQPIVPDATQPRENEFYEFQLERVEGVYLTARECGIGMIQSSTGSVKFMVLNQTAACTVRKSCCLSCTAIWATIVAISLSAGIFGYSFWSDRYRYRYTGVD